MHSLSKLSLEERLEYIKNKHKLSSNEIKILSNSINEDLFPTKTLIENMVGYFAIPLGFVTNFVINDIEHTIPIATEESSIIAGLINSNLYVKKHKGSIKTKKVSSNKIGQIQIPVISDIGALRLYLANNTKRLILKANEGPAKNMFARGGGVNNIFLREIGRHDGALMGIIHVIINTADAMGANTTNQTCEFLKNILSEETKEDYNIAILSNLSDDITEAEVFIPNVGQKLGRKITEASLMSQIDTYRAATSNKGIMNAIDGILIATGNDFRATEACMHAYAATFAGAGSYTSLSKWDYSDDTLYGKMSVPISVGIVGGATTIHPTAKLCIKILGIQNADSLSQICVGVGLMQNFAALRALCTDGIVQGHMNLHLQNFVGHNQDSQERAKKISIMRAKLKQKGFVTFGDGNE